MALAPTVCEDKEDEVEFHKALEGWLPEELRAALLEVVPETVLGYVAEWIALFKPDEDRDSEFTVDDFERPSEWIDLLADYGRCYGQRMNDILDEDWPSFLLFAGKVDQINAREQMRQIEVMGFPYIQDDYERSEARESLLRRANRPKLTAEAELKLARKRQREMLRTRNPFANSSISVKNHVTAASGIQGRESGSQGPSA